MARLFFILSFLWTSTVCLNAQTTLYGSVIDKFKQPIPYVLVNSGESAEYTDAEGRFSIVSSSSDSIRFSSPLYRNVNYSLGEWINGHIVELADAELATALVIERKLLPTGSYYLTPTQLRAVPALAGEVDVLRALQSIPAIAGGAEGSVAPRIRGSEASQSNIMLDGTPIYSPSTLFGYQGSINYESVRDVNVYAGYVPAKYGGRSGGVIDVNTRFGDSQKHRQKLSVGVPNVGLVLEGPLPTGASYLVAGRGAYVALPSFFTANQLQQGDILAKLSWQKSHWVNSLQYFGNTSTVVAKEALGNTSGDTPRGSFERLVRTGYGNQVVAGNTSYVKGAFGLQARAAYTQYRSKNELRQTVTSDESIISDDFVTSDINAALGRFIGTYSSTRLNLAAGVEVDFTRLENSGGSKLPDENALITSTANQQIYAPFAEMTLPAASRFIASVGLRAPYINNDYSTGVWNFEPRLNFGYHITEDLQVSAGYNRAFQYLHAFGSSTSVGSFETYATSTQAYPLSFINQYSFDYRLSLRRYNFSVSGSVYYKEGFFQVEQYGGTVPLFSADLTSPNRSIARGIAQASGIETSVNYARNSWEFRGSYTYARSFRKYPEINQGEWYPFRWERPHRINVIVAYHVPDSKWSFSGQAIYESGFPYTAPVGTAFLGGNSLFPDTKFGQGIYDRINNRRSTTMQRLDLGASWTKTRDNGTVASWNFSLYNALLRRNPSVVYVVVGGAYNEDRDFTGASEVVTKSLFNFIPGIQYSFKW